MLIKFLIFFSAVSFLYYGFNCLFFQRIILEFKRFGLSDTQRIITGIAQILGSIGLLIGLKLPIFGVVASIGLTFLMFFGLLVRLKIRDSFIQSLPALLYLLIAAYLALAYTDLMV